MPDVRIPLLEEIFDSASHATVAARADGWTSIPGTTYMERDGIRIELVQDRQSHGWAWGTT